MGNPNVLFNNAGITNTMVGQGGNIESLSVEEFENTWKVNTGSSYLVIIVSSFGVLTNINDHLVNSAMHTGYGKK